MDNNRIEQDPTKSDQTAETAETAETVENPESTEVTEKPGIKPGPPGIPYETYYDETGRLRTKNGKPFGRSKGVINKITGASLLEHLAQQTGRPYGEQLAINYRQALDAGDKNIIIKYDTLILNKVISDRIDVTVGQNEDQLAAKNAAFMAALAVAGGAVERNRELHRELDREAKTIDIDTDPT